MKLKTAFPILRQRVLEDTTFVHASLGALMALGAGCAVLGQRRKAVAIFSQVHRTTRLPAMRRLVEPYIFANRSVTYSAVRSPGEHDIARHFGGRVAVLKEPGKDGERGVLFVMFTEMLSVLFATMDVRRLISDFTIVSEPSWSGYCDEEFLRWTQLDEDVFVLAAQRDDFAFLQRLGSNLIPIELGPCDWVDPRIAAPFLDAPKEFDIVMNAHWGSSKRHHVLFRMLHKAKRRYKVLLIGSNWGGKTAADVAALADYYGVKDQLTFVEHIPYEKVMALTCSARVSVLLSLKEGSNRAISESIFCNVPVVVLANHVGGIVKNVRPETGLLTEESGLEMAIEELIVVERNPREWGLAHISFSRSSAKLNEVLRAHAQRAGRPWTRDVAPRTNSPESRYANADDAERLGPWNRSLAGYLIP